MKKIRTEIEISITRGQLWDFEWLAWILRAGEKKQRGKKYCQWQIDSLLPHATLPRKKSHDDSNDIA